MENADTTVSTAPSPSETPVKDKELKTESGLVTFARNELNRILAACGDPSSEGARQQAYMNEQILHLIQVFSEQGHTGFTAGYAISMLKRLLNYKPVSTLKGTDDEWNLVWEKDGHATYQNKRCPAVFKDEKGVATYLDCYVISDNGGHTWFHSKSIEEKLGLSEVIQFPFAVPEQPSRVYIKYTTDVPLGEVDDEHFVDITNQKDEIAALYEAWQRKREDAEKKTVKPLETVTES